MQSLLQVCHLFFFVLFYFGVLFARFYYFLYYYQTPNTKEKCDKPKSSKENKRKESVEIQNENTGKDRTKKTNKMADWVGPLCKQDISFLFKFDTIFYSLKASFSLRSLCPCFSLAPLSIPLSLP